MDNQFTIEMEGVSKQFRIYTSTGQRNASINKRLLTARPKQVLWALKDISLQIPRGIMFGIIGENGSGKTTLLKIISGITPPTTGKLKVNGKVAALLDVGVGFHPDLSGIENIFLYGSILGLSREELRARLSRIIEFSGLTNFIYMPVKYYSAGMFARLGFSLAVNTDPDILLVDEILAVGDIEFQRRCIEKIKALLAEGKTIILVSHEVNIAAHICQEVLWLHEGQIQAQGDPVQVVEQYKTYVFTRLPQGEGSQLGKESILAFAEKSRGKLLFPNCIEAIRLLDENNRAKEEFHTGEKMTVEINYHFPGEALSPCFMLSIAHKGQTLVCNINSREQGLHIERLNGRGKVLIHFEPLLLLAGPYNFSLFVYDHENPDRAYAIKQDFARLEVRTDWYIPHVDILADLPCSWQLERAESTVSPLSRPRGR